VRYMTRLRAIQCSAVVVAMAVVVVVAFQTASHSPAGASGGSYCNGNTGFCSGSDGETFKNQQQNTQLQIYIGEIGNYYHDFTPPGKKTPAGTCSGDKTYYETCFYASAMVASLQRKAAHQGIGFAAYYILAGAQSSVYLQGFNGWSPYCWGWAQGGRAVSHLEGKFSSVSGYDLSSVNNTPIIFADIEGGTGWVSTTSTQEYNNRSVFNGFSDYIAGRSPAQDASQCRAIYQPQSTVYQYGIYSYPSANTAAFQAGRGGPANSYDTYKNTPLWTAAADDWCPAPNCLHRNSAYPGTFTALAPPDQAAWFGNSDYKFGWQFWSQNHASDFDIFSAPITFPINNVTLGR